MLKFNNINPIKNKLFYDDSVKVSIDFLTQYYHFGYNYVEVRGWAFKKNDWFDKKIYILLDGINCHYLIETNTVRRDDVAEAYSKRIKGSGFNCRFRLNNISKGVYQVLIAVMDWRGRLYAKKNNLNLEVTNSVEEENSPDLRDDLILSVHIFKTGGTSFGDYLNLVFNESLFCYYPTSGKIYESPLRLGKHIKCIHGHLPAKILKNNYPNGKLISWVRDPVERVCSEYYHIFRYPEPENPIHQHVINNNISLKEFIQLQNFQNVQSTFIHPEDLKHSFFVGIMEEFDTGLFILDLILHTKKSEKVRSTNINPQKNLKDKYELDKNLRDEICRINYQDVELYNYAKEHFSELKQYFS